MPDYPPPSPSEPPPKLLDLFRDRVRRLGYAKRTELSYVHWIKRFILFHDKRHPKEMGKPEVEAFLTSLAVERNVAASTQNLALSAILLPQRSDLRLYRRMAQLGWGWVQARLAPRTP